MEIFLGFSLCLCGSFSLISREAIEQSISARRTQLFLAAALRVMGGIPRAPRFRVVPLTIVVPHACLPRVGEVPHPVAARGVRRIGAGKRGAVGLRTGQHVMTVWRVAAAVDRVSAFGQRGLLADVHLVAVELLDASRDQNAFRVVPGAGADALACVPCGMARRSVLAQIGTPRLASDA